MKFSLTTNTSLQRRHNLLFPNQLPLFLLLFVFWRIPRFLVQKMVSKNSVDSAYFRKAGQAFGMNKKGHILVYLGQFKEETPLFRVWKCQQKKKKTKTLRVGTPCNRCLKKAVVNIHHYSSRLTKRIHPVISRIVDESSLKLVYTV